MIFSGPLLRSADWPKDYVVREHSESPDGRYALLVQTADAADAQESNESNVYLGDLKAHTALGPIQKVDYFDHQNHRSLDIFWAPDSSYCLVQNDGRYGLETLMAVEIKDSELIQTEIDEKIQKSLDDLMKKKSRQKEESGYVSPHFRLGNDRKIRVRATSQNNPKQFEDVKTYYTLFQGTYDLNAKKWTISDARLTDSIRTMLFRAPITTILQSTLWWSPRDNRSRTTLPGACIAPKTRNSRRWTPS